MTHRQQRPLAPVIREYAKHTFHGPSRLQFLVISDRYNAYHWAGGRDVFEDFDEWSRASDLVKRYHRFRRYVEEIKPQWSEPVLVASYANADEYEQTSALTGVTRRYEVER